ncbi:hypothetical protein LTR95_009585 [Oleoguttula sp. CCFEE 5521]
MSHSRTSEESEQGHTHVALPLDNEDGFLDQPEYGRKYDYTHDKKDMSRLGRRQQLKRRFKDRVSMLDYVYFYRIGTDPAPVSIAEYVVVLGNTWEFVVVTAAFSLANGGTAGAIWTTLIVCADMFLCVLSKAEVASMAPTSGGWQAGMPAVAYIFAQQILALISVCNPDYVLQGWHGALMTIASATSAIVLSVYVMQRLTLTQGLAVAAHVIGFVAFLTVLWVKGPGSHTSASEVLINFEDLNGWGSYGLATLVAIIGPISTYIGGDSAVQLAEELQDANYVLPRAMVSASAINYVMGTVALITFMFNVGPIDDGLYIYGGQPWVTVIYRITGSKAATIMMIVIVAINFYCLQINMVMTSSRQVWAFARDKGLPFSPFLAKVTPNGTPRKSVAITLAFTILLSLIIIGSFTAFSVILSFGNAGIYTSYVVILLAIIYRRFDGNKFPPTKFSLGRWGLAVNLAALIYISVALVFTFFPPMPNPTPASMWVSRE